MLRQTPSRRSSVAPAVGAPTTIYLLRHGDTQFSSDTGGGKVGGWLDVPLTDEGEREAHGVGRLLKRRDIADLYCSSNQSAVETATIIGHALGLNAEMEPDLRSWNLGEYAGQSLDKVWQPIVELIRHPDQAPKGGETFIRYRDRVLDCLERIFADTKQDGDNTVIITHSRNLRLFDAWYSRGMHGSDLDIAKLTTRKTTHPVETVSGFTLVSTDAGWKLIADLGTET
jgi:broad specificity phosphatase PhoE